MWSQIRPPSRSSGLQLREGIFSNDGDKSLVGFQEHMQGPGEELRQQGSLMQAGPVLCPDLSLCFFSPAGVRRTRVDTRRLLQCSSTSVARMGHVRVCDSFRLFSSLPGRVPLWHGDSD